MGYIDNNLINNEQVMFKTRFHWWIWGVDIFLTIIFIVLAFVLFTRFIPPSVPGKTIVVDGAPALFAVLAICSIPLIFFCGLLMVIGDVIGWSTSELGVTNRRILAKKGWIRRRIAEINLSQFESCQLSESLIGRLLGYKTVVLTGSGGTREVFKVVAQAKEFRASIMEQVDLIHHNMGQYAPIAQERPQVSYQQPGDYERQAPADPLFDLPPEDPTAQLREVSTLIKAGKRNEAGQIVRRLLQTNPQNADVWYLAGYLHTDPNKKRAAYEKSLSLNPQHRLAQAGLANLK